MYTIGLVDLDTSHPVAWTPRINSYEDMQVTAVWDSGDVNPRSYVEEFAEEHSTRIATTLEEMADLVDAVIIHGTNWDQHLKKALVFVEAGLPVLIDKPIVGKLKDADELLALSEKYPEVPIMGGSSVRFCEEIQELKAQKENLGEISCAFASGVGDFFSYGIHTVEFFQGFFGSGVRYVDYVGENQGAEHFKAVYEDGTFVMYQLGALNRQRFFVVMTSEGAKQFIMKSDAYNALIDRFHDMLISGEPPIPLEEALEAVKVQLAAKKARSIRGAVYLEDLVYDEGFDGEAYTRNYRIRKWNGKY